MQAVLADSAVSVSELKRNPSQVVREAGMAPVAVLNHNQVMAYMVPAKVWEALMERLDDQALVEIARQRADEPVIEVRLDEL